MVWSLEFGVGALGLFGCWIIGRDGLDGYDEELMDWVIGSWVVDDG